MRDLKDALNGTAPEGAGCVKHKPSKYDQEKKRKAYEDAEREKAAQEKRLKTAKLQHRSGFDRLFQKRNEMVRF